MTNETQSGSGQPEEPAKEPLTLVQLSQLASTVRLLTNVVERLTDVRESLRIVGLANALPDLSPIESVDQMTTNLRTFQHRLADRHMSEMVAKEAAEQKAAPLSSGEPSQTSTPSDTSPSPSGLSTREGTSSTP
jgi:hypothetical protein